VPRVWLVALFSPIPGTVLNKGRIASRCIGDSRYLLVNPLLLAAFLQFFASPLSSVDILEAMRTQMH
jgi:hypothetical protein